MTGGDRPSAPPSARSGAGRMRARGRAALDRLVVAGWTLESALRSRRRRARTPALPRSPGGGAGPPAGEGFPPFDLHAYHPIGWPRAHDGGIGTLGPPDRLPPSARGFESARRVAADDLRRLRRLHHLRDHAAFHPDADRRAALLARLAGAGVLVHPADESGDLRDRLGADFHRLLRTDPAGLEDSERELLAVESRRMALRLHSDRARAGLRGDPPLPTVSILLPTRRPEYLRWALANAARQTYPETELVLGLHGSGFDSLDPERADLPPNAKVIRVPAERTLGGVLRALGAAASGPLLAKMDDDDLYAPDHLWDLVLAREFSRAELVGKWPEYLFLARQDCTVRWRHGESERYQRTVVGGGTLLLAAETLAAVGGWRDLRRGVDPALAQDIRRAGGKIYRTHGAGYLMVRHGSGHTWNDDDSGDGPLLLRADRVWPGFDPARAGVAPPPFPHPGLGERPEDGESGPAAANARPAALDAPPAPPRLRRAAAGGLRLVRRAARFALRTDPRLGARYLASSDEPKLHLGCGSHLLPDWLNTDLHPRARSVMRLDAARRFPFPEATFRYIYTEHVIACLPLPAAAAMLRECRRVLVPGGRLRVSTPHLEFLLGLCEPPSPPGRGEANPDPRRTLRARYLEWQGAHLQLPANEAGFVVNAFLRAWGHRFLYDRRTLRWLLRRCGFDAVVERGLDESGEAALRGLAHTARLPPGFLDLETLTVEAERPLAALPGEPAPSR